MRHREILEGDFDGLATLDMLTHSLEISVRRLTTIDSGAPAESKKPRPQSGLLRQVPPSREAAIHAMPTLTFTAEL
jgi:hypothetical protein